MISFLSIKFAQKLVTMKDTSYLPGLWSCQYFEHSQSIESSYLRRPESPGVWRGQRPGPHHADTFSSSSKIPAYRGKSGWHRYVINPVCHDLCALWGIHCCAGKCCHDFVSQTLSFLPDVVFLTLGGGLTNVKLFFLRLPSASPMSMLYTPLK